MTLTDEMLMAYVDGELDDEARAAVERAMAGDAEIARRIADQQSLRRKLSAAYDPVLAEPVPDRLIAAARTAPAEASRSNVIPLRGRRPALARRWSMREWTAIAASLILGALVSALVLRSFEETPVLSRGGRLVAGGALAASLSTQLASRQAPDAPVAIGVTFIAKSGDYCRTFVLRADSVPSGNGMLRGNGMPHEGNMPRGQSAARGESGLAGLACHDHGAWQIEALARSEPPSGGAYRQASSSMPPAVLDAVSAEMAGEPLDARAEAAARAQGWKRR